MKDRKHIKLELNTIVNLINCAEDYGFTQLYDDFFQMLDYKLSGSEIENYAKSTWEDDEDSYESSIETLTELRDRYCGE